MKATLQPQGSLRIYFFDDSNQWKVGANNYQTRCSLYTGTVSADPWINATMTVLLLSPFLQTRTLRPGESQERSTSPAITWQTQPLSPLLHKSGIYILTRDSIMLQLSHNIAGILLKQQKLTGKLITLQPIPKSNHLFSYLSSRT